MGWRQGNDRGCRASPERSSIVVPFWSCITFCLPPLHLLNITLPSSQCHRTSPTDLEHYMADHKLDEEQPQMASPQTLTNSEHDTADQAHKPNEEQPQMASPLIRIIFCALVFVLAVGLGISVGFTQRTAEFNPTHPLRPPVNNRIVCAVIGRISILIHVHVFYFQITLSTDLIAIDATAGTMTLDWSFMSDTACNSTQNSQNSPCPGHNPNSTVDIYFDMYVYLLSLVLRMIHLRNLNLETFYDKMNPEQYRPITYQRNPSFATMPPQYTPLIFAAL